MELRRPGLRELVGKSIVTHTVTYFLVGLFAFFVLDYREAFSRPYMACWMRSVDDPLIAAGPLFQPIRGIVFALAFYPLREVLFGRRRGWLIMWWLLVALGILSTFGPAPGSFEGLVFTRIPPLDQLRGWIEVVPQAFLFSALLYLWVERPGRRWWSVLLMIAFFLVLAMSIAGLLAAGAAAGA
jgi:hypothetical protein